MDFDVQHGRLPSAGIQRGEQSSHIDGIRLYYHTFLALSNAKLLHFPARCAIAIVTISHKVLIYHERPAANNTEWNQVRF